MEKKAFDRAYHLVRDREWLQEAFGEDEYGHSIWYHPAHDHLLGHRLDKVIEELDKSPAKSAAQIVYYNHHLRYPDRSDLSRKLEWRKMELGLVDDIPF